MKNMDTQTTESRRQELAALETKLDEAAKQYRQLKEKIAACEDEESDEARQKFLEESFS